VAKIQLCGSDVFLMKALAAELELELQQRGLSEALRLSEVESQVDRTTRGEPVTLAVIALCAVGAGGALTALLGKDGFLSALARVLEKYIESRRAEVVIVSEAGRRVQVSGPVSQIKKILQQIEE